MIEQAAVKRILVIKLRAIGDVLLSTVVLKDLRAYFPDARIEFLTEAPSRAVVEGNASVDEVITFDAKRQQGVSLVTGIRRRRYDLVIDLFGNPRSAIVTFFSGARYRVGYRLGWRRHCYNVIVEPRGGSVHNSQFNRDALARLGVPRGEGTPEFPLGPAEEAFADAFMGGLRHAGRLTVAINPGGGWWTKRWPEHSYAILGDRIASQNGARILILWGPGEEERAGSIKKMMTADAELIPATTLKQLGAILKRCDVLVTNDSGPMHIAASVGTPIVAIFGPTNPELQGPVGTAHVIAQNSRLLCLGCNLTSCPIDHPCMGELLPEEVYEAFKRCLATVRTTPRETRHEKANRFAQET